MTIPIWTLRSKPTPKDIQDYIRVATYIQRAMYTSEGHHIVAGGNDFMPDITEAMLSRYFPLFYTDYLNLKQEAIAEGVLRADVKFVCYREMAKNALRLVRRSSFARNQHFIDTDWSVDSINTFAQQYKKEVKRGQDILATLYHEYGHAFFFQIAEYLKYGSADMINIEINKWGGGFAEQTNTDHELLDGFTDALLSLAGIAAARFSGKGFRIYSYRDDTIHSKYNVVEDIKCAKIALQLAGIPKPKVHKAALLIISVLEAFFALLHIFNYYDWQTQLLSETDPTITYHRTPDSPDYEIHVEPDHFKAIFELAKPDATLFSFIDLRQLASDVGASISF
jgi:hypothetical protein